jgi:DNA-binding NtrC family response regulator
LNHWDFLLSSQVAERVAAVLDAPRAKTRVLIVDDDSVMREMLVAFLEEYGFAAVAAEDVDLALRTIDDGPVDAVVSDIRMPRKDGFALLRGVNRLGARTPIILMSSFASATTEREALRAGACAFVHKPFAPDELLRPLGRALGGDKLAA